MIVTQTKSSTRVVADIPPIHTVVSDIVSSVLECIHQRNQQLVYTRTHLFAMHRYKFV